MPFEDLLPFLEEEIKDADEETFLLYSNAIPSQNLGFIDPKATSLEITLADRDLTIHQSPTVLGSTRAGGTTGAVLWKVAPLFAEWLSAPANPLFTSGILAPSSTVLELGCGISPLNALAVAPRIARYVLSDQGYVRKLAERNLSANRAPVGRSRSGAKSVQAGGDVHFRPLDWEQDEVTPGLAAPGSSFDVVLAADCVYNYALAGPFVQTLASSPRTQALSVLPPPSTRTATLPARPTSTPASTLSETTDTSGAEPVSAPSASSTAVGTLTGTAPSANGTAGATGPPVVTSGAGRKGAVILGALGAVVLAI
ncbi:Diaminohydroxyphosphoribosylamino-pyrimidine deaminase [Metarhizium brunneum]|uniref:Diaminohydroxyphosphoribosylamino-pyrimidine deaminase n=1 Tax=Metarhizium brunneum TaxID=500148 RepID=A0A7D5URX8_9HYPO|nr:Diaminohydroxyphosphoribosylamino-pyrimidine deaminase [Metarhizium brunneum]